MPTAREPDLEAIRRGVALIGRLSDGLLRIGPFNLGLDAALSWIPGLGEAYSAGAAVFLILQGARAGVPVTTLAAAAALMGARTIITAIPIAGTAAADLLTAHRWSARMILAAIDRRIAAAAAPRDITPPRPSAWRGPAATPA